MKDLKEEAREIFAQMMSEIDISRVVPKRVRIKDDTLTIDRHSFNLSDYQNILLIGIGKGSIKMGSAFECLLGDRLTRGLLVSNYEPAIKLRSEVIVAGHPLPNANSLLAGEAILSIIKTCNKETLVIFLISGGGSALVERPLWDDVTLEDFQQLNHILTRCGATISEINTIRKHLSGIKGGRLGFASRHTNYLALYISDVNPGDIRSIASNPLMQDEAALTDFYNIIEKYSLQNCLPSSFARRVRAREIPALPAEWVGQQESQNIILLENRDALIIAADIAERLGYTVETDVNAVEGEYKAVADNLLGRFIQLRNRFPGKPVCLISGGEVSCEVKGNGLGGRNQEFVLYSALRLLDSKVGGNLTVLSCGTDGIDGITMAAGAVADAALMQHARSCGIDPSDFLSRNDSYSFFEKVGGLIITGPTGNNVRDVRILISH